MLLTQRIIKMYELLSVFFSAIILCKVLSEYVDSSVLNECQNLQIKVGKPISDNL